jgi:hypothetical protein
MYTSADHWFINRDSSSRPVGEYISFMQNPASSDMRQSKERGMRP